jgi:Peroxiredoxin
LRPGDPAPHFALPAVNREGQVSLDDYRGRSPVLVALFRGLHCPFCRRHLVQLGTTQDKLKAVGVETMAVVNTPAERARLYFKYRPAKVLLAADPEAATHQAFRLPAGVIVEDESATSVASERHHGPAPGDKGQSPPASCPSHRTSSRPWRP